MDVKPAELVNRFDVINAIKETYCVGCDSYHGIRCRACNFDDAMSAIDSVPAFDLKTIRELVPSWISVKDRLPDDDVRVLVCSNDGDESHAVAITHYTHRKYGYNIEGWIEPWQYFFYNHEITHWMPLPKPPKEES